MGILVLTDAYVYAGGYDFQGDTNDIKAEVTYAELSSQTFGSGGWEQHIAGLGSFRLTETGFWQASGPGLSVDDVNFANLGLSIPIAVGASSSAGDGSAAYFGQAMQAKYGILPGKVGDVGGFTLDAVGASGYGLVPGVLATAKAARTATATGTVYDYGSSPAATRQVYAELQIFAVSGTTPTLDVTIQSSTAANFASPTTRITFAQQNAQTALFATPVTGITDRYWRASWTIGGTATPTFTFAVLIGIR